MAWKLTNSITGEIKLFNSNAAAMQWVLRYKRQPHIKQVIFLCEEVHTL